MRIPRLQEAQTVPQGQQPRVIILPHGEVFGLPLVAEVGDWVMVTCAAGRKSASICGFYPEIDVGPALHTPGVESIVLVKVMPVKTSAPP